MGTVDSNWKVTYGLASPATDDIFSWNNANDIRMNLDTASPIFAWICTVAGRPGTWIARAAGLGVSGVVTSIAPGNGIRLSGTTSVVIINSTIVEGLLGGQTAIGDTAASGILTLRGTSNAVNGSVIVTGISGAGSGLVVGGAADTASNVALDLRAGNSAITTYLAAQITLGYNNSALYRQSIRSRHQAGAQAGNSIDFFTWTPADTSGVLGSVRTLSLDGGQTDVLSLAAGGMVKAAVTTGRLSIAVANTDYMAALSLTAGSVLFSGGGAVVSQDNANFYWDDANNRLHLAKGSAPTIAAGAPLTVWNANTTGDVSVAAAIAARFENTSATGQTIISFAFGGTTPVSGLRADYAGNLNLHIPGAQGVMFYSTVAGGTLNAQINAAGIALQAAGTQGFTKVSGQLNFGTADGNIINVITSNTTRAQWSATGTLTQTGPTSGTSLILTDIANVNMVFDHNAGGIARIRSSSSLTLGAQSAGSLVVETGGTTRATWGSTGTLTQVGPSGGTSLALSDASAFSHLTVVHGPSTANVRAGTGEILALGAGAGTNLYLDVANGVRVNASRFQEAVGSGVTAATTLFLPNNGTYIVVSGAGPISFIDTTNWQPGAKVTLQVANGTTFVHGASASPSALFIPGGTFTTLAPWGFEFLQFQWSGSSWNLLGYMNHPTTIQFGGFIGTFATAGMGTPVYLGVGLNDWSFSNLMGWMTPYPSSMQYVTWYIQQSTFATGQTMTAEFMVQGVSVGSIAIVGSGVSGVGGQSNYAAAVPLNGVIGIKLSSTGAGGGTIDIRFVVHCR